MTPSAAAATPKEKPAPPLRRRLLYGLFTLGAFLLSLLVTFPYGAVKDRLAAEASARGLYLRIGNVGPGFLGVRATDLELSRRLEGNADKSPVALKLDSLTLRPSLLPLGVGFSGRGYGARFAGAVGGRQELTVKATIDGLDVSNPTLASLTGLQTAGRLEADLLLKMPVGRVGRQEMPELNKATGSLVLKGDKLEVKGGNLTVPMYGASTTVKLEPTSLGNLDVALQFDAGAGTIQQLSLKGGDVELNGSGTLKLERELPLTVLAVELRVKVDPAAQKRLGLLGNSITLLPPDQADKAWRVARLNGLAGQLGRMPGGFGR
jgi:type II secretion system protein N